MDYNVKLKIEVDDSNAEVERKKKPDLDVKLSAVIAQLSTLSLQREHSVIKKELFKVQELLDKSLELEVIVQGKYILTFLFDAKLY